MQKQNSFLQKYLYFLNFLIHIFDFVKYLDIFITQSNTK